MSGRGKKQRRDLRRGQDQFNAFANRAIERQEPFARAGAPAIEQLAAASGLRGEDGQAAVEDAFRNSLFFTGGETDFGLEKDAIDAGLSAQGLLYSQSRQNAVADARKRNYANAFRAFLGNTGGVANIGAGAAANQGNAFLAQGGAAMNTAQGVAGTRRGFLDHLQQVSQIGANAGRAGGFG